MFCEIENGFYSVCFHCQYLSFQKLKNFVFYIKQHVWADTVLKSGCVQFLNLLTLTEMGSVSDRKWFSLTHLLSLRIFECWKIRKCCFSSKIMHLSRHTFELWAWSILKFAYLTEMHSVEDREWFLVAHLLCFSIFDCSKVPKCCFLTKIITMSRHSSEQWAWQVLDFT